MLQCLNPFKVMRTKLEHFTSDPFTCEVAKNTSHKKWILWFVDCLTQPVYRNADVNQKHFSLTANGSKQRGKLYQGKSTPTFITPKILKKIHEFETGKVYFSVTSKLSNRCSFSQSLATNHFWSITACFSQSERLFLGQFQRRKVSKLVLTNS